MLRREEITVSFGSTRALESINGVESFINTALIDLGRGPSRILVGTCGDLERYASRIVGVCEPDTIQLDAETSFDDEVVAQLGPVGADLRAIIDLPDGGSTITSGLLPPDLLPADAFVEYNLDLAPGADLEEVGAALVRAAPGIGISGIDSPDRGRLISTYTSLSLAATLAAVADRSLERRRHAAHLTALGLPPNTLRNAETLTLVTPLAIGIDLLDSCTFDPRQLLENAQCEWARPATLHRRRLTPRERSSPRSEPFVNRSPYVIETSHD